MWASPKICLPLFSEYLQENPAVGVGSVLWLEYLVTRWGRSSFSDSTKELHLSGMHLFCILARGSIYTDICQFKSEECVGIRIQCRTIYTHLPLLQFSWGRPCDDLGTQMLVRTWNACSCTGPIQGLVQLNDRNTAGSAREISGQKVTVLPAATGLSLSPNRSLPDLSWERV